MHQQVFHTDKATIPLRQQEIGRQGIRQRHQANGPAAVLALQHRSGVELFPCQMRHRVVRPHDDRGKNG